MTNYDDILNYSRMELLECHGLLTQVGVPRHQGGELMSLSQRLEHYMKIRGATT